MLYDVIIYPVEMLFICIYHVVHEGPVHAYEMLFREGFDPLYFRKF